MKKANAHDVSFDSYDPLQIFGVSAVLPGQTYHQDDGRGRGERALLFALLVGAIEDTHQRHVLHRAWARAWLMSDALGRITFVEVCELLGLDPVETRRAALDADHNILWPVKGRV